jgi:hypothetical protein
MSPLQVQKFFIFVQNFLISITHFSLNKTHGFAFKTICFIQREIFGDAISACITVYGMRVHCVYNMAVRLSIDIN